ncbi:hypothetical protein [Dolichospermum sp. UHCC 0406]|uniref:hypothetical protein n=1 Tax=Dolichospermum sp. UHCC 0406 TaxID=2590017 RepID=UPI001C2BDD2D|nr:hypothetical protein [Dolichospermum sp. UHCC 0406]
MLVVSCQLSVVSCQLSVVSGKYFPSVPCPLLPASCFLLPLPLLCSLLSGLFTNIHIF